MWKVPHSQWDTTNNKIWPIWKLIVNSLLTLCSFVSLYCWCKWMLLRKWRCWNDKKIIIKTNFQTLRPDFLQQKTPKICTNYQVFPYFYSCRTLNEADTFLQFKLHIKLPQIMTISICINIDHYILFNNNIFVKYGICCSKVSSLCGSPYIPWKKIDLDFLT